MNTSTAPQHTPGPWHINGLGWATVFGNDQLTVVADLNPPLPSLPSPEAKANARLIAAAPDLLEALQHILAATTITFDPSAWNTARAAIAKATGTAHDEL